MYMKFDTVKEAFYKKVSLNSQIQQIRPGDVPAALKMEIIAKAPKWVKLPPGFWKIKPDPRWTQV